MYSKFVIQAKVYALQFEQALLDRNMGGYVFHLREQIAFLCMKTSMEKRKERLILIILLCLDLPQPRDYIRAEGDVHS